MKNLLMLLTLTTTVAGAQSSVDYNKGFCVRFGESLVIENAIIRIDNQRLNDGHFLNSQAQHNFFDFDKGALALHFANWSGNLALVKPADRFIHGRQVAMLMDYTHHGLNETLIVECKAIGE